MADVFLVPMLYKGATFGVKSEDFPCINKVAINLKYIPEFIKAAPER